MLTPFNAKNQQKVLHQFQGKTMGTDYRVSFVASPGINLQAVKNEIQRVVGEVDDQMSTWKSESDLSQFNRSIPGEWIDVPANLAYVVNEALKLSAISKGAFDVTLGSSVNLWGFGPEGKCKQVPDIERIHSSKTASGYKKLEARLEPASLRKTSDCYVDLSGIAKGFGVDQMANVLDDMNIGNYLVAIDGEVRLKGSKGLDRPWTIAVENPVSASREAYDLLQPADCSIATSGDYRNFVILKNKRYSHTIDNTTGRPVENDVGSVSVKHASCMMADAWATALLAMGYNKGSEVAREYGISALFLLRENGVVSDFLTPGFEAVIGRTW